MSRKRNREVADLPEDPEQDLPLGTQESSLFELQVRNQRASLRAHGFISPVMPLILARGESSLITLWRHLRCASMLVVHRDTDIDNVICIWLHPDRDSDDLYNSGG
jgi:hypothetical protein